MASSIVRPAAQLVREACEDPVQEIGWRAAAYAHQGEADGSRRRAASFHEKILFSLASVAIVIAGVNGFHAFGRQDSLEAKMVKEAHKAAAQLVERGNCAQLATAQNGEIILDSTLLDARQQRVVIKAVAKGGCARPEPGDFPENGFDLSATDSGGTTFVEGLNFPRPYFILYRPPTKKAGEKIAQGPQAL